MHALVTMSASASTGSGTSITATYPSAPAVGTVLIAGLTSGQDPTEPAGWTVLSEYNFTGTRRTCIYTKVADGTEGTAVTVTFGTSSAARLAIIAVSGVRTVSTDAAGWIVSPQTVTGSGVTFNPAITSPELPLLFVSACGLSTAATSNLAIAAGSAGFTPTLIYSDTLFGLAVGVTEKRFAFLGLWFTDAIWTWTATRTYGGVHAAIPVAANTMATLGAGF